MGFPSCLRKYFPISFERLPFYARYLLSGNKVKRFLNKYPPEGVYYGTFV
jgi:hypothetical protein